MFNSVERQKNDKALIKSVQQAESYSSLNTKARADLRASTLYKKDWGDYKYLPLLVNNAIAFSNTYQQKQKELGFTIGENLHSRYWDNIKNNSAELYTCFKSILSDLNDGYMNYQIFGDYLHKFNKLLASGILLDHSELHSEEINTYTQYSDKN